MIAAGDVKRLAGAIASAAGNLDQLSGEAGPLARALAGAGDQAMDRAIEAGRLITAFADQVSSVLVQIDLAFGLPGASGPWETIGRAAQKFSGRPAVLSERTAEPLRALRRYYRLEPRSYHGAQSVQELLAILSALPATAQAIAGDLSRFAAQLASGGAEAATAKVDPRLADLLRRLWEAPAATAGPGAAEVAEDFGRASGGRGRVVEVEVPDGEAQVPERAGGEERVARRRRHAFFTTDNLVFDPRYAAEPVPFPEYMGALRRLNPGLAVRFRAPAAGGDGPSPR